jgi:hypothetical protein
MFAKQNPHRLALFCCRWGDSEAIPAGVSCVRRGGMSLDQEGPG